ncbi:hypothetical protein [Roseibium suaedae]|uniref:hypothetical protein n=1 Tax=Roseibium suaedae TaxID=735517 RepID=UPI001114E74F|nr:hypothetical protein [Roseibium suaedae]
MRFLQELRAKFMKSRFLISLCFMVSGCAGVTEAMKYQGTPIQRFEYAGDNWRIFDKPAEGKMMTTPSIGAGISAGTARGLTFGIAGALPEGLQHQEMAKEYLKSTGRESCSIFETKKVIQGQYEIIYKCN